MATLKKIFSVLAAIALAFGLDFYFGMVLAVVLGCWYGFKSLLIMGGVHTNAEAVDSLGSVHSHSAGNAMHPATSAAGVASSARIKYQISQQHLDNVARLQQLHDYHWAWDYAQLAVWVEATFLAKQAAWMQQDFAPLRERISPVFTAQYQMQFDHWQRHGETPVIREAELLGIELIRVEALNAKGDGAAKNTLWLRLQQRKVEFIQHVSSGQIRRGVLQPQTGYELWTLQMLPLTSAVQENASLIKSSASRFPQAIGAEQPMDLSADMPWQLIAISSQANDRLMQQLMDNQYA